MEFEEEGGPVRNTLLFEGVEAFKCTYLTSCSAEMFNVAYGKLAGIEGSRWLDEMKNTGGPSCASELRHLMICFDDGPCYEFVCTGYKAFESR